MDRKVPSSLQDLKKLIDEGYDPKTEDLKQEWLEYIYDSLYARKTYHQKQQIKRKILMKVAAEHLSSDEMESVEKQAEEQVEKRVQTEEESDG